MKMDSCLCVHRKAEGSDGDRKLTLLPAMLNVKNTLTSCNSPHLSKDM